MISAGSVPAIVEQANVHSSWVLRILSPLGPCLKCCGPGRDVPSTRQWFFMAAIIESFAPKTGNQTKCARIKLRIHLDILRPHSMAAGELPVGTFFANFPNLRCAARLRVSPKALISTEIQDPLDPQVGCVTAWTSGGPPLITPNLPI